MVLFRNTKPPPSLLLLSLPPDARARLTHTLLAHLARSFGDSSWGLRRHSLAQCDTTRTYLFAPAVRWAFFLLISNSVRSMTVIASIFCRFVICQTHSKPCVIMHAAWSILGLPVQALAELTQRRCIICECWTVRSVACVLPPRGSCALFLSLRQSISCCVCTVSSAPGRGISTRRRVAAGARGTGAHN